MTQFLTSLVQGLAYLIRPVLVPLCLILAWGMLILTAWSVWTALRDGWTNARRMHKIPCSDCRYFTENYFLKCPVHPDTALSEDAINCVDYETKSPLTVYGSDPNF